MNKQNIVKFSLLTILIIIFGAICFSCGYLANRYFSNQKTNESYPKNKIKSETDIIDSKLEKCISRAYSTQEMNICAIKAREDREKELNNILNSLKKVISKTDYEKISASQAQWEKSLEEDSLLIEKFIFEKQGTIFTTIGIAAGTELVKQRALFLNSLYFYIHDVDKI